MTNLSFEDFLEAFVRAAGMKSLPTDKVREPLVAAAAAARGSSARRRRRRAHAAARRTPHAARARSCRRVGRHPAWGVSSSTVLLAAAQDLHDAQCADAGVYLLRLQQQPEEYAQFLQARRDLLGLAPPPFPSFSPALSPYAALLESFLRLQARAVDSLQPGARQPVHRCVDHLAALMIRTVEGGTSYKDDGKISRKEAAAFDQHGGS